MKVEGVQSKREKKIKEWLAESRAIGPSSPSKEKMVFARTPVTTLKTNGKQTKRKEEMGDRRRGRPLQIKPHSSSCSDVSFPPKRGWHGMRTPLPHIAWYLIQVVLIVLVILVPAIAHGTVR